MGQSNQRSVSLKTTAFTAPSVANKGNRIRVLSREALLHITVEECTIFSFMVPVSILLPAWSAPGSAPTRKEIPTIKDSRPNIESVTVERVVGTKQNTANNRLKVILQETPSQILHCQVKNLNLTKKILPAPSASAYLATASYTYQVEIKYKDLSGRFKQESFDSGTRYQQIAFEPSAKTFNVAVYSLCTFR